MAKLMIKAIGLFGLTIAYASGAWAACGIDTDPIDPTTQIEVCAPDDKHPNYAVELFGAGADDLALGYEVINVAQVENTDEDETAGNTDNQPKVVIELPVALTDNAGASITYTLIGAVFAERAGAQFVSTAHTDNEANLRVTREDGGAAGDDFVAFAVEATGPFGPNSDEVSMDATGAMGAAQAVSKALIVFAMPELTGTAGAMTGPNAPGISVSVVVERTSAGAGRFGNFPESDSTVPDQNDDGKRDADKGIRMIVPAPSARGVTVATLDGANGVINPETREMLVGPAQQMTVGGATVTVNDALHQLDGTAFSVLNRAGASRDGGGAGALLVTSQGDFRDGDMLFWSVDAKYNDTDTMLEIDEGMATAEFDLFDVDGTTHNIHYIPNGEDPLRSGSITTTFAVAFENDGNVAPKAGAELVELNYLNAATALLAYAIAPPSNPDDSNIRVRCDSSSPCQVYFACDGADGAGYFGKMDGMIGARMVDTLNAMELADVIGAVDADFAGRMSCEVIGSSISVQVLTRSGDALVNNTYVGGPIESSVRMAIESANEATKQAITAGASAKAVRDAQCAALAPGNAEEPTTVETDALKAAGC